MKKITAFLLAIMFLLVFSACSENGVASVELGADSISAVKGVNITIPVVGYDEKGNEVEDEVLSDLGLIWMCETETNSFVLYDGALTPIAPGAGTVWVECENSDIKSQKIEVLVEEGGTI